MLAIASWDSYVRIYRIDKTNPQPVQPHQQYQHEGPVLDVCFNAEGSKVISVGVDKVARCFDLNTNQTAVVAQHNDTIRCVRWIPAFGGALVTGSWDKTVKLWKIDPQPTLISSLDVPERVYAMDTIGLVIIVATAERKIVAFQCNEAAGTAAQVASMDSPLKFQSRSLAALPEGDGFALGGTEGRVAVHFFHDPPDPKDGRVYVFPSNPAKSSLSGVTGVRMPTIPTFLGMKRTCSRSTRLCLTPRAHLRPVVVTARLASGAKLAARA